MLKRLTAAYERDPRNKMRSSVFYFLDLPRMARLKSWGGWGSKEENLYLSILK
jgi:hypothetical protein